MDYVFTVLTVTQPHTSHLVFVGFIYHNGATEYRTNSNRLDKYASYTIMTYNTCRTHGKPLVYNISKCKYS